MSTRGSRELNTVIIGGGKGCESILRMVKEDTLGRFQMKVLGVADVDPNAVGMKYARELSIPTITTDYRELLNIDGLDLILELTGSDEVRDELEAVRPRDVHLIDHFGARLFFELHQAEEAIILHRTQMRQKEEQERERVSQILNSIPDEILVVNKDMVVVDANDSFLRNNRLTMDQVLGNRCYELKQPIRGDCQVALENCPFFKVMEKGEPVSMVRKHFNMFGQARFAAIVGAPIRNRDGSITGMIEMTRDITHRISLEQKLAASEIRLKKFMELAPVACVVKNRSGQYIDVNAAACKLFAKSEKEILGKTDFELFPAKMAEAMRRGDGDVWKKLDSLSVDLGIDYLDNPLYLSTVKFPILDGDGQALGLCCLAKDVTAETIADMKLKETREYLQNILDNSPVIIITTDLDGRVVSFNRGAQESLGYSAQEVIGKSASMFYDNPQDRQELLQRIQGGKPVRDYSQELLKKDGSRLQVSLTFSQLKDSSGKMIGTVGICKDISHRKMLMRQVLQSERMAAVGRLASGVAHEINNPLAIIAEIAGFLSDLVNMKEKDRLLLDKELQEGLPKILSQVKRGRAITQRLLTFARKSEARITSVRVNESLDEILPFLEKEAQLAQVQIHRKYEPELPEVQVEEMQFQEVFINLVTNAIQALSEQGGGNVWLETRRESTKVVILVRDDGPGIDDSVRERLFDPFVSTKPTGLGTGLGLSICYGIVKRFDGEIRVESEPGEGATFSVFFPEQKKQLRPIDH